MEVHYASFFGPNPCRILGSKRESMVVASREKVLVRLGSGCQFSSEKHNAKAATLVRVKSLGTPIIGWVKFKIIYRPKSVISQVYKIWPVMSGALGRPRYGRCGRCAFPSLRLHLFRFIFSWNVDSLTLCLTAEIWKLVGMFNNFQRFNELASGQTCRKLSE